VRAARLGSLQSRGSLQTGRPAPRTIPRFGWLYRLDHTTRCPAGSPQWVMNILPHSEHFSSAFSRESRPYPAASHAARNAALASCRPSARQGTARCAALGGPRRRVRGRCSSDGNRRYRAQPSRRGWQGGGSSRGRQDAPKGGSLDLAARLWRHSAWTAIDRGKRAPVDRL
jgi:hypothetical protein